MCEPKFTNFTNLPIELYPQIFTYCENDLTKIKSLSKQFTDTVNYNKDSIAFMILKRYNFKPEVIENNKIFDTYITMRSNNWLEDPSTDNNYAIRWASGNGHLEVVRLLLSDPRVDPSVNNNYAIRRASENGHTKIVRLLLVDPRVDPSANNNYAIRRASGNGHLEVVRLLLDCSHSENYDVDQRIKK